jgi:hypothetical protein
MFQTEAEVNVKDAQNKVVGSMKYQKIVLHGSSLNDKGEVITGGTAMEALLGDAIAFYQKEVGEKGNGLLALLEDATYAHDLGVRAKIRQGIVKSLEGPDKSIAKMVDKYIEARLASGKPVTREVAEAKIKAMLAED